MQHEVPCDICGSACGFECLEAFTPSRQDIQEYDSIRDRQLEYIKSLEWQLDNVCEKLGEYSDKNMALAASNKDLHNKLQASVSELDIGNEEENLGELCELVYLPPRSSDQKQS